MGKGTGLYKKTIGKWGALNTGFMVLGGIGSYSSSRQEGHGVAYSLGKTVVDEIFYSTPVGKAAFAAQLVGMGAGFVMDNGRKNARVSHNAYKSNFGGNYSQSKNGYTMRQRGLNAINNAGVNAQQALGSEARTFHRSHYYD